MMTQGINKTISEPMNCFNLDRWLRLMASFGFNQNVNMFNELVTSYQEKHRKYHTAEHINATLQHFDVVNSQFEKPKLVELALWFHDAIYTPFSSSNEADSAQWVKQFLHNNKTSPAVQTRVVELIMATLHTAQPDSKDKALLVDIDLSILGAKEPVYRQFSRDIRFEYKRVPYFLYKKKRKEVLRNFLNRETVYQTSYFRKKLESQARVNMESELDHL